MYEKERGVGENCNLNMSTKGVFDSAPDWVGVCGIYLVINSKFSDAKL